MPAPRPGADPTPAAAASASVASPIVLEATVVANSRVPQAFTVPYKDCLTYVSLHINRVVEGQYRDKSGDRRLLGNEGQHPAARGRLFRGEDSG